MQFKLYVYRVPACSKRLDEMSDSTPAQVCKKAAEIFVLGEPYKNRTQGELKL